MGALVEVLQERHRHLEQGPLGGRTHAELEEAAGQAVAVLGLVEQPVVDEVAGDAVHGPLRQAGATDQLGEREQPVVGAEGAQDRDRLAEHRVELGVLRATHADSVPVSGTRAWFAGRAPGRVAP